MEPIKVTDAELSFGPKNVDQYIPKNIPEQFYKDKTVWNKLFNQWFFNGLSKNAKFKFKENIDEKMALRHISTLMRSFEPKHEVKEAACSYLMSMWLKSVETGNIVYKEEKDGD